MLHVYSHEKNFMLEFRIFNIHKEANLFLYFFVCLILSVCFCVDLFCVCFFVYCLIIYLPIFIYFLFIFYFFVQYNLCLTTTHH